MAHFEFEAIGTLWQVDIVKKLDDGESAKLLSRIQDRIDAFDRAYSRFRPDSLVTRMSQARGIFFAPLDAAPMLALYRDLYDRTGGLFTPLVGDMLSAAGYDAGYSLRQKKDIKPAPSWDETFDYRSPNFFIREPAVLDFGAAGKGYLVDLVAEVLESEGIFEYCIDAGGDIVQKGAASIRVGLEDPSDPSKVIGVCELHTGSICGSAGNRRAWGDFTHIMDPKTGTSPKGILSVWVTAHTAMQADALATCLFFVDPETLKQAYDFEYVILRSDRTAEISRAFSGEIFIH